LLVIRLARIGRNKYPTYRIVAAESACAATGRFVEVLGHYNPHTKELVVKHDRVLDRLSHGAQPSNTVAKLLIRDKVELPAWVKLKTKGAIKADPADEKAAEIKPADTEVTEAEAAADAIDATEEVRVAEVATDNAAKVSKKATGIDEPETAAAEDARAESAEAMSEAAAEATAPKATESK
jgi:small subunit ribosomal protein S16